MSSDPFNSRGRTVAELRQLIEAGFASGRDGRRLRNAAPTGRKPQSGSDAPGPMSQLRLARQRLMERLPRIEAGDSAGRPGAAKKKAAS